MMLTPDTAVAMGIKDRADPRQNIIAGARRYYAAVRAKIPDRVSEPDRTWLALAAYNVGFGHLEDARIIAQTRSLNPDSWIDVREECHCSPRNAGIHAQARLCARLGAGTVC